MITEQLVRHLINTSYDDIPDKIIEHGKKAY